MQLTEAQRHWLDTTRQAWSEVMRPGDAPMGAHLFGRAADVPQAAVEGARLYASRLAALEALPKGGQVAEIGTQAGRFARHILDVAEPTALHLFDIEFDTLRAKNPDLVEDPRIRLHLGDSSTVLATLPDRAFAWIYVDGDHSEAGIARDALCASRKIVDGGLLVFNDYTIWSPLEMTDYGTVPVVNGMLASGDWEVVYLALHPLMYCDIAIRRRRS